MKNIFIFSLFLIVSTSLFAQKYMTRNGYIGFFSSAPFGDIKADNNQVASELDASTGELAFKVLIKSFHFEKALMEKHFNKNYMESEIYPNASFKGKIDNFLEVDFKKNGEYNVIVSGEMTIHGITKLITANGILTVIGQDLTADSKFLINPEDYNIEIPGIVKKKIAKGIEITVRMNYKAL
jgi:polyisoprenoid-binding protein YceI